MSTPVWIWLDTSAACNLACRDCYTKRAHAPNIMSVSQFNVLLQKLTAGIFSLEKLHLNWRGEPLTNKKFPHFLEIRKRILPHVPIEFHTNGLLLSPRNCADIVAHTLPGDVIYVSVDGGRRAAHEANRGRGTWDPTLAGLKELLNAREQSGKSDPTIGIYEIHYGDRLGYDPELIALSRRCDGWARVDPIDEKGYEKSFAGNAAPNGPCFWAGNALCITATGDAHVCLLSFRGDGVLGNVFVDDLAEILTRAQTFRKHLAQSGRTKLPHCRGCWKTEGALDGG
jgi:sulfatase maturation enzyme AslB (radical SAM superfamily)